MKHTHIRVRFTKKMKMVLQTVAPGDSAVNLEYLLALGRGPNYPYSSFIPEAHTVRAPINLWIEWVTTTDDLITAGYSNEDQKC